MKSRGAASFSGGLQPACGAGWRAGVSQPEFAKYYADEYRRWGDVIRAANIRLD